MKVLLNMVTGTYTESWIESELTDKNEVIDVEKHSTFDFNNDHFLKLRIMGIVFDYMKSNLVCKKYNKPNDCEVIFIS